MRKSKSTDEQALTVSDVLNDESLEKKVEDDEAFKFLKKVRSSPAFWQQKQRELMSMIRQLGCPTFFLTLSAAETKWTELLRILKQILDDVKLSVEEVLEFQWSERADLIRRDPVTCARYFDHRSKELFKVLRSEVSPLGKLTDYYLRIEFQHRGSPHVHSLLWVQDAPKYGHNPLHEVIEFIDRTISCALPDETSMLTEEDIKLQRHKHTHTCYKKKSFRRCRFGIPYPPMVSTKIIEPLEFDASTATKEEIAANTALKETAKRIYTLIDTYDKSDTELDSVTIQDFFNELYVTEEQYVAALRSCINRPTIFLKRDLNEIRINAYNVTILYLWKANMDLQYILDPYACAVYVISYIGKSQRGMSKLLRDALMHLKAGNATIKERLRGIAYKFQSCSEVSAQEVSYHLLSLPLSKCSRANVYINTNPANKRVRILKSKPILMCMEQDSVDILQSGLIEHYMQRPDELEETCLAKFAAWYEFQSSKRMCKTNPDFEEENIEDEGASLVDNPRIFPLKDTGFIRIRRKAKVIRFRRYNIIQDEVNFYREQLMLFVPWRIDTNDTDTIDYKSMYASHVNLITQNRELFESRDQSSIDEAINILEDLDPDEINFDGIAIEEIMKNEGAVVIEDTDFLVDNPGNDNPWTVDPNADSGTKPVGGFFNVPNLNSDEEFLQMCRCLNNVQRTIFLHTLHCFKTMKQLPMFLYIGGGAGVGKSTVIRVLHEGLVRYMNSLPGTKPDAIKVLLTAPTGKAAFNIHGMTLHSAFALPVTEFNGEMPNLSSDVCNTLRSKLSCLKVIIIDEISMVGSKILSQVNNRLKAIMDNSLDFGGVSIISVGDFHQLRPVKDSYVFQIPISSSNNYDGLVGPYLWEKFSFVELTEIMRQKDDLNFARALTNFANCCLTEDCINLFTNRIIQKDSIENLPIKCIHLFSTNASVNAHNETVLNALTTEGCRFIAIDSLVGDTAGGITDKLSNVIKHLKVSDTQGLPYDLFLKLGARYLMTLNNDIQDGLVNGATGLLKKIVYGTKSGSLERVPCILWMEFDDPTVGKDKRAKSQHRYLRDSTIQRNWTPIGLETRRFQRGKGVSSYKIVRKQFPFIVAEALTIHKSQGDTYDCVALHIELRMPRNALYTALSRAKSASGLFVVGNLKLTNKLSEKDPVYMELKRLKEHCAIMWSIPLISPDIYVHNVRSLNKHWEDLSVDPLIVQSQVLVLQETMTLSTDNFNIPGHTLIGRIDGNARVAGSGTHIYSRNPALCKVLVAHSGCHNGARIEILIIQFYDPMIIDEPVVVMSIYRSPQSPMKEFYSELDQVLSKTDISDHLIVTGDFNVDLFARSPESNTLIKYFANKGMIKALSRVSTNYGSQLDCIFTKNLTCSCGFYESYFSDHKPMLISLGTVLNDCSSVDNQPIISHATNQHDIIDIDQIPNDNTTKDIQDVIVSHVYIPTPVLPLVTTYDNANTFTFAMRQSLAQCINLQRIPLRPTNYTGCRVSATGYYDFMRTNVRDRFNFRIVPITGDGNCFFRTLSHIIFGDETEHHNIRGSLIETFEQSPYVDALCGIQGYNAVTIQQHFSNMKRNYSWGTVNELVMLGILAGINVSYINAADTDPIKWVITDVYNANTLGIPSDPIYGGRHLIVLFHSINFSGSCCNHYDVLYPANNAHSSIY